MSQVTKTRMAQPLGLMKAFVHHTICNNSLTTLPYATVPQWRAWMGNSSQKTFTGVQT